MEKVAIVILNWNGIAFLEKFLPAVVQHCPGDAGIYVIDNASTDQSVPFLEANFPGVHTICLDQNFGFAGGYNKGLEQIEATYFVLLNSDVEVTEGWIEPLVSFMDNHPEAAGCQPKIRAFHQKTHFEYAGGAGGFIDRWSYPFCRGRLFHITETDQRQYDDLREIFWASGCALFIRADLYKKAGGLDEDFFAHMEEIDLCWRLKNQGYSFYYHPQSLVYHVGGGTLTMGSPKKTFLNFRNNLWLMAKNLQGNKLFTHIFIRLCLDGIAALSFLPKKNGLGNFLAVIKAHFAFYGSLSRTLKKRSNIPATEVSCIYRKSIVWEFYGRKKQVFTALKGHFTSRNAEK